LDFIEKKTKQNRQIAVLAQTVEVHKMYDTTFRDKSRKLELRLLPTDADAIDAFPTSDVFDQFVMAHCLLA
jgi:hypothetical protein